LIPIMLFGPRPCPRITEPARKSAKKQRLPTISISDQVIRPFCPAVDSTEGIHHQRRAVKREIRRRKWRPPILVVSRNALPVCAVVCFCSAVFCTGIYSRSWLCTLPIHIFADFQQSTESGSDSFQEGSYYSRNLPYRFVKSQNNVVGSVQNKNEKKSLQRDFEDLLQKYRKSHLMK
jgi:hypothetical protein